MCIRTYDAHRFSPLKRINRQNAGQLRQVWMHEMGIRGRSKAFRSSIVASCTSSFQALACERSTPRTAP